MKRKSDFKAVVFNENEPHTAQEWWIYWLNRYNEVQRKNYTMSDLYKDKLSKGLVLDPD